VKSFDTQTLSPGDLDRVNRGVLDIEQNPAEYPGIAVSSQAVRTYPQPGAEADTSLAAHILGYLSPITADDKTKAAYAKLQDADLVGRGGLEQEYDQQLRGTDGTQTIAVNAAGDPVKTLSDTDPVPGEDVVLNIDAPIQRAAEQALQNALTKYGPMYDTSPKEASAVVLTTTGQVVAIASTPSYDPSVFTGGVSDKVYKQLSNPNGGLPLLDRAVDGEYAPGSTWKVFMTAGLLQNHIATEDSYRPCPSSYKVGNQVFKNFEGEAEPPLTLAGALTVSCDTVFYSWAYDQWVLDGGLRADPAHRTKPANEYLVKAAKEFGFGSKTGIDLPGESAGYIVDRAARQQIYDENKKDYCEGAKRRPEGSYLQQLDAENCKDGYTYRAGDATTFAIGQGTNIDVTPLQLARGYAAIANGGTLYTPTLAKAFVKPDGTVTQTVTPKATGRIPASADLGYIRDALYSVTHDPKGTASGVFGGYPIPVSGKTGTAEVAHVDSHGNQIAPTDTSWFASFAPSNDPKYVVVVDVPGSEQGAHVAAPAVKDIYDAIFGVVNGVQDPSLAHGRQLPTTLPCFQTDTGKVGPPSRTCSASLPQTGVPSTTPSQPPASASGASASTAPSSSAAGAALTPDRRRGPPPTGPAQ
jgi:penicillin-binding protein 2